MWIWNNQVCKHGIAKWIDHIPKSVIFLDPSAPWAALKNQAEYLNIKEISLYELYCEYIFPHFNAMDSAMRIEHIKFILKGVFGLCKYESESTESPNQHPAQKFIRQVKGLNCIGDNSMSLCNIGSLYDHTQEIFTIFCEEQHFLPKVLQDDKFQEGLKFFGLRSVPTTAEFLDYCHCVSSFIEISTITKASKCLLEIIFQDEEKYQHIYDEVFLKKVSHYP